MPPHCTDTEQENGLQYGRYGFSCRVAAPAHLNSHKGAFLRGTMGHALKKVVCAQRLRECGSCILAGRCLYARLYEDAGTLPDSPAGGDDRPRPYVIEPREDGRLAYEAGDGFDFDLILFGCVNESFPYFVYAFWEIGRAAREGRTRGNGPKLILSRVEANGRTLYSDKEETLVSGDTETAFFSPPALGAPGCSGVAVETAGEKSRLRVSLVTPLKLKFSNGNSASLPFNILMKAVLRRISILFSAFGQGAPAIDHAGLLKAAEDVSIAESSVSFFDRNRLAASQDRKILTGSMTGEMVYQGDFRPFLPFLTLCELMHVGKQTSFGLGKISIATEAKSSFGD